MGLKSTCDACGKFVVVGGLIKDKASGRYLCSTCAENPTGKMLFYCNSCHNSSARAVMKGNGWIELILYFVYIIPGILYSIWRRSGQPNICPICNAPALVPISAAKPSPTLATSPAPSESQIEPRAEIECPFCAEKILAKAKFCKHCGKEVRIG